MKIDAHHHLWDLSAVSYPWIIDPTPRFFGDHTAIRRNYLLDEFSRDARASGFAGSVHIQVGAADPWAEAIWVQSVADADATWPMVQVVFCDLTVPDVADRLAAFAALNSVRGVRQIVGRSPQEDAATGTNDLLDNPHFLAGLRHVAAQGFSFDLQLIPELMPKTASILAQVPDLRVALCHAGSPYDRSPAGLERWRDLLAPLAALPQVSCKLSGLGMFDHGWTKNRIAPIVGTCLAQFGADRLMFGSNFPVCSLTSDYRTLVDSIGDLAHHDPRIFGLNAKDFYCF